MAVLITLAGLLMAVLSGVFLSFSDFIMRGLIRAPAGAGAEGIIAAGAATAGYIAAGARAPEKKAEEADGTGAGTIAAGAGAATEDTVAPEPIANGGATKAD